MANSSDWNAPDVDDDLPGSAPLTGCLAAKLERACVPSAAATARDFVGDELRNRVFPALRERALAGSATVDSYRRMILRAQSIIEDLFAALHSNFSFDETDSKNLPRGFWHHQEFDRFRAHDGSRGFAIHKDSLLTVAAAYLQHPEIQTNRLDWIFLDSMVLMELEAFSYYVFNIRGGLGNWAATLSGHSEAKYYGYRLLFSILGVFVWYVVPIGSAYYLLRNGHETSSMVIIGILVLGAVWRLATYPFRLRARRRIEKLLQHMIRLYATLGDSTIPPTRWRERLNAATADGVVLDGAVFALIDRAIARDPTAFIPS